MNSGVDDAKENISKSGLKSSYSSVPNAAVRNNLVRQIDQNAPRSRIGKIVRRLDTIKELVLNNEITADQLAEKLSRDRLALLESRHGADRIETATELNRLAQLLQQCGKKAEAAKIRKRVINIVQGQYPR